MAQTTMRADARRNREKLLTAAVEAFSEAGTDVSLEAVAKRAGVGIGTLYRHFHTREALVEAAYRSEVERLTDSASELLAALPADVALAEWMDRFVEYAMAKRGMKDALQSVVASRSDLFANTRERLVAALAKLLDAGIAQGSIRTDANADDVLHATSAIWTVTDDGLWPDQPRRLLRLVLDGLRYGAAG